MRKFYLAFLLALTAIMGYAQKLDDIKDLYGKNQLDKAKEAIDKYLSVEKNAAKSEGWYYKSLIYNDLAKNDSAFKGLAPNGRADAFASYKKYLELDPKNIQGTLTQNVLLFDLYNGYFDKAAKGFNAKDYKTAYENFKNAEEVQQYVFSKGFEYNSFKFPKLDTNLVLNTAISAANAKMDDEAMVYYAKLAEAKVSEKNYSDVYKILVEHYMRKKDDANMMKYIALGQEVFPKDDYWIEIQIDAVGDDKQKVIAKYEELIAKYPTNYVLNYNLAVEIYNLTIAADTKPANMAELEQRMVKALEEAIKLKPESADAALLEARYYYNKGFDLSDEARKIKGTKPEDVKKKNEITAKATSILEKAIPNAEKAVAHFSGIPTLKASEKANYKVALDILVRVYEYKKMADKAKVYSDKIAALDK